MSARPSPRILALLALLTGLTLALRLTGIGFGVPVWEEPDPDVPGHVDLLREGRTFAGVEHPDEQYPHLLADIARRLPGRPPVGELHTREEHLHAAAWTHVQVRALVALIATMLVPLSFLIGRRFVADGWALFAAALVATSLLHQSFAQQARPHGAAATFFALAVLADLRLVRDPSWRSYVLAGLAAALALGTLHSALAVLIPGLAAHVLRGDGRRRIFDRKLLVPIAACLAAVIVFYPFLYGRSLERTEVAGGAVRFAEHAISFAQFNGRGFLVLAQVLVNYEPVLTALLPLALFGLWLDRKLVRDDSRRPELKVVLWFALPYLAAIGLFEVTYERFLLPLLPFLALCAAAGLAALVRNLPQTARTAALAVVAASLALPAAACAKLAWLRSRPDTLGEVAHWIEEHARDQRVYLSASQPLDVPLVRTSDGFKPFGTKQLTPWTRWQVALPPGSAPEPRYDLRWLAAPPPGTELGAHLRSLGPALFVVEDFEQRAHHRLLHELHRALAQSGQRLARFSPDPDLDATELELFFQLSDHFNEGVDNADWPNFTARVLAARAIGPVVEIWRLPAADGQR